MLTYNREKMLAEMIRCVLSQDFSDYEFIIVDNGSTDNSGAIADGFAAEDSRIRVIHREKGTIGSGRNTGLSAASGDYIAFLDDDDVCTSDYLSFLWKLITNNDADISICGASNAAYDESAVMTAEEALITLFWRKRYNSAFPTKLFKKCIAPTFSENDMYDDISAMYKVLMSANRVAYSGQPKYTFIRHDNNSSIWTAYHKLINRSILSEYLRVYRTRTVELSVKFPNRKSAWEYFEWSFMLSMTEKITKYNIAECYEVREEMVEELKRHRNEFLGSEMTLPFEKEWFVQYVGR